MYHFTESGLRYVYLHNGYHEEVFDDELYFSITELDRLQKAIALSIVHSHSSMTHEEFRFLRKEIDASQSQLAALFEVSEQTVARWEKAETGLPRTSDVALRSLYCEQSNEPFKLTDCLMNLSKKHAIRERKEFGYNHGIWSLADK